MINLAKLFASLVFAISIAACSQHSGGDATSAVAPTESAEQFVARVNAEYKEYWREINAADWLYSTYINDDSAIVSALANERFAAWRSGVVKESLAYDDKEVSPETRRALDSLKLGALLVAPDDDAKRNEQAQILTDLQGSYGAGKYCRNDNDCQNLPELETIIAQNRDYDELLEAWVGWRTISPPMRDKYARYAELANATIRL